jgi:hypothetical protein
MKQKQNETEHLLSTDANKNRLLEDVAERLYPDCNNVLRQMAKETFINGAKWQQERSYSEEEVLYLLQKALTHKDDGEIGNLVTAQGEIRTANFFSWFEQFKNK